MRLSSVVMSLCCGVAVTACSDSNPFTSGTTPQIEKYGGTADTLADDFAGAEGESLINENTENPAKISQQGGEANACTTLSVTQLYAATSAWKLYKDKPTVENCIYKRSVCEKLASTNNYGYKPLDLGTMLGDAWPPTSGKTLRFASLEGTSIHRIYKGKIELQASCADARFAVDIVDAGNNSLKHSLIRDLKDATLTIPEGAHKLFLGFVDAKEAYFDNEPIRVASTGKTDGCQMEVHFCDAPTEP